MDGLEVRLAKIEDQSYLLKWLSDPSVLRWFPMSNEREIADAVRIWMSYISQKAVLTAVYQGEPVGSANLYLQSFAKLAHHSLFAIIIEKSMRGKGVGTALLKELIRLAKESFHLEFLYLEVYEGNPAIGLYKKLGFREIGKHTHFIKEGDKYYSKIFMEKYL